jgi:hypothetical protein
VFDRIAYGAEWLAFAAFPVGAHLMFFFAVQVIDGQLGQQYPVFSFPLGGK